MAKSWRRVTVVGVTAGLLLTAMTVAALAQAEGERLGGKVRAGGEVIVPAEETVPGHLYVTGGTIEILGDVEGDLIATGGQIRVSGTIGGDALLAGGDVAVDGDVGGSTRVAGGQVVVTGRDRRGPRGRRRPRARRPTRRRFAGDAQDVALHRAVEPRLPGGEQQVRAQVFGLVPLRLFGDPRPAGSPGS